MKSSAVTKRTCSLVTQQGSASHTCLSVMDHSTVRMDPMSKTAVNFTFLWQGILLFIMQNRYLIYCNRYLI